MSESNINNQSIKQWEELRRLARQFENSIDTKLFSFSKLMSTSRNEHKKYSSTGSASRFEEQQEPLITCKDNFDNLKLEIECLINSLEGVNHDLEKCREHLPGSMHSSIMCTLERHQDILNDYKKEFYKISCSVEEQINRDLLFQKHNKDYRDELSLPSHLRKNDFLMKENDHIRNSEIMIDDQINIAIRTRDTLRTQRSTMKAIRTQLTTLANKFPMINNVMHRISMKKRKDSIILAIVIGVCLFILLFWIF